MLINVTEMLQNLASVHNFVIKQPHTLAYQGAAYVGYCGFHFKRCLFLTMLIQLETH